MLIFNDIKLRKKILQNALPAILEMILYMFIGVIDILIVGKLGAVPLASVSLGAQIFLAIILFLSALGTGSCILVAQSKGSRNIDMVNQVAAQTFLIAISLGIITGFLGILFSKSILSWFQIEPEVFRQTLKYLQIVFLISPFAIGLNMLNGIFRGMGRTDIPMKIAGFVNVINILGDYILVYGKLGLPALGVTGAALATSLAHIVGFSLAAYVFFSGNAGLHIHIRYFRGFRLPTVKSIFCLGLPSLGEQFTVTSVNMLSIFLIVFLGTIPFASHQIALNVESISFMPGYGIAIATTALIGRAIGSMNTKLAHRYARASIELAVILMGSIGVIFAIFSHNIAALFTNDVEMIALSGTLLRIASLEQIPMALSLVLGGILKGTGNTKAPMIVSVIFICFFRFPLMYLIIQVWQLPITYIWVLFVIDWVLRAFTYLMICTRRCFWQISPSV